MNSAQLESVIKYCTSCLSKEFQRSDKLNICYPWVD